MLEQNPQRLYEYAISAIAVSRLGEAIEALERCVSLDPNHVDALTRLAQSYGALGYVEEARHFIERFRRLRPNSAMPGTSLAKVLADIGRIDEARDLLRKVVAEYPLYAPAWQALTRLGRVRADDPMIAAMLDLITKIPEPSLGMKFFCLALSKVFDDTGEYARAFEFLLRARRQAPATYDAADQQRRFAALREVFDKEFFRKRADYGVASERPIFIVGMPRSGTSLAEQILASHPDVFGAGELDDLKRITSSLGAMTKGGAEFPFAAQVLKEDAAAILAFRYLRRLQTLDRTKARVVDKMPTNFPLVGLINLLFPKSTIVHTTRHPLDVCLSCLMLEFNDGNAYNQTLEGMANYYRLYAETMAHWREVSPIEIHEVNYETLVADFRPQSEALLRHAKLPWDERVMDFHTTERRVATPSNAQVRTALYSSSIGRWKNYERELAPLIDALGPLAQA